MSKAPISFEQFSENFLKEVPAFQIEAGTDIGLAFDGSGSMGTRDVPDARVTRWNYAKGLGEQLAEAACEIDTNGIDVVVYDSAVRGQYFGVNMQGVTNALRSMPGGGTSTHLAVQALYNQYLKLSAEPGYNKKYRAYVITDGATNVGALSTTIVQIANEIGQKVGVQTSEEGYPFTITFLSVGQDIPLPTFYELDNNLNTPYDIVRFGGRLEALDNGADAL